MFVIKVCSHSSIYSVGSLNLKSELAHVKRIGGDTCCWTCEHWAEHAFEKPNVFFVSCCLSFFSLSMHFFQISRWVVFDKETFAAFIEHKIESWKRAKTCNCCPIGLVKSFYSLSGSDLSYCVKITFIVVRLEDRLDLSSLFDHINRNKKDTSNSLCEYSTC